jgi:uncharacterized membrane protein
MRARDKGLLAAAAVAASAAVPSALRWVRRTGAARRAVDLRMTLVVERPLHEVFEFCRDFENFPRIVDVLLSVEDSQDGRSHWAVRSPTGQTIEWDATVTKYVPNSVIAWQSVPGSAVEASGTMRFAPLSDAETRLDIALTYLPQRTDFTDAMRAFFAPTNARRIRSELVIASEALSRVTPASPPPEAHDHPIDARPDGVAP